MKTTVFFAVVLALTGVQAFAAEVAKPIMPKLSEGQSYPVEVVFGRYNDDRVLTAKILELVRSKGGRFVEVACEDLDCVFEHLEVRKDYELPIGTGEGGQVKKGGEVSFEPLKKAKKTHVLEYVSGRAKFPLVDLNCANPLDAVPSIALKQSPPPVPVTRNTPPPAVPEPQPQFCLNPKAENFQGLLPCRFPQQADQRMQNWGPPQAVATASASSASARSSEDHDILMALLNDRLAQTRQPQQQLNVGPMITAGMAYQPQPQYSTPQGSNVVYLDREQQDSYRGPGWKEYLAQFGINLGANVLGNCIYNAMGGRGCGGGGGYVQQTLPPPQQRWPPSTPPRVRRPTQPYAPPPAGRPIGADGYGGGGPVGAGYGAGAAGFGCGNRWGGPNGCY